MTYQIYHWVHIISYISWLLAFVISLGLAVKVRMEDDAIQKRKLMRAERIISGVGTYLGSVGILLSGAVMSAVSPAQWGWFRIQLYPWLALKQLFFIIIFLLIVLLLKRDIAFRKRLNKEQNVVLSTETSDQWRSTYRVSLVIYILMTVATVIGWMRPF